jgi:hypothetical protein
VREYEKTVLDELALMREAANASQLKRNFAGSRLLYVPEIHWDLCRDDVMVMERIHGVPIGDLEELRRRGVDFKRLAENGVEIFTQVFHQLLPRHAPILRAHRRSGAAAAAVDSASSARSTCVTSATSRRISPSSLRLPASPSCTSSPAGCRPARASSRWNPPCARSASRSSTGH